LTLLTRLDLVGCLNITAKSLEALKASLQYRNKIDFDISIDGSIIPKKQASEFAAATGASMYHDDRPRLLSINKKLLYFTCGRVG